MSQDQTTKSIPFIPNFLSPLIFIFIDSIKLIFINHPKLFFYIYISAALPLSLSVASLSLSAVPRLLKLHIRRLEFLYQVVDIWVEAANVKETCELDLKQLYRYKLLHFIPVFIFSLFNLVAVVTAVASPAKKRSRPGFRALVSGLKARWAGPAVTCVVTAAFWVFWALVTAAVGDSSAAVKVLMTVIEIYVMAVFSVAGVVSVAEERAGVDAIRAGSGLMKGRRAVGWVLSGLILLTTSCIGREIVGVMDGQDLIGKKLTAEMRVGYMIGLMMLLGWVIMWSYVVITVYYCDCRKRHGVIRQDDVELVDANFEF
ncbi:hypothetical protein RND81_06G171800 [Saponaria officinalis]|uniref:Transmembrane protein n=1 Tax=Saponaria officinalis TaxID=3572 RepID=A0AAW1KCD6_SAPOF